MNTNQKKKLQNFFERRKKVDDDIMGLIWNFYRDLEYAVKQDCYIHFLKENQNYIQNMNRKEKNNLMNFFQQRKLYNDEVRDLIWGSSRKYGGTRKSRKTKQRKTRKQRQN